MENKADKFGPKLEPSEGDASALLVDPLGLEIETEEQRTARESAVFEEAGYVQHLLMECFAACVNLNPMTGKKWKTTKELNLYRHNVAAAILGLKGMKEAVEAEFKIQIAVERKASDS